MTNLERFLEKLRASMAEQSFVKITLSRGRGESGLRNVYGRLVELKSGTAVSFTLRYANRDVTRNDAPADAPGAIEKWLGADFEEAHLFTTTGDWKLRAEHGGEWKMKAGAPDFLRDAADGPRPAEGARLGECAVPRKARRDRGGWHRAGGHGGQAAAGGAVRGDPRAPRGWLRAARGEGGARLRHGGRQGLPDVCDA